MYFEKCRFLRTGAQLHPNDPFDQNLHHLGTLFNAIEETDLNDSLQIIRIQNMGFTYDEVEDLKGECGVKASQP